MEGINLKGKNILISGASSGIGAACCKICSDAGANLIMLGRDQGRLDQILGSLPGNRNITLSIDLVNPDEIETRIEKILNEYVEINGFIHSAGTDSSVPLHMLRPKDYQSLFAVNAVSGFEIARLLSKKRYCPENGASYIFIASVMGMVGEMARTAYSSSKGALIAGCRSMALELAPKWIRVNCVSPAVVKTRLLDELFSRLPEDSVKNIESKHPLGIGLPQDIAGACLFLLSDYARWITGTNLVIDGGYSCR